MGQGRKLVGWFWTAARLLLAAGLVGWLVWRGDLEPSALWRIDLGWFALSFLLYGVACLVTVLRFQLLLRAQEIRLSFLATARLTFIGLFFNIFLPGATGGDVVKAWYAAASSPGRRTAAVTVVFFDRLVGAFALTLLAGAAILADLPFALADPLRRLCTWVMVFFLAAELLAFAAFLGGGERWGRLVEGLLGRLPLARVLGGVFRAVRAYRGHRREFLAALACSLPVHLIAVLGLYLFALALGDSVGSLPPGTFLFLAIVALFVNAVPGPPGGLGVGEWGAKAVFDTVQQGAGGAMVIFLLHLNVALWSLVGGVWYVLGRSAAGRAVLPEPAGPDAAAAIGPVAAEGGGEESAPTGRG